MRFDEEDNSKNDYFDGPDIPDQPVKKKEPKGPELQPEDPEYWDQPESEWEHLKPPRSRRFWLYVVAGAVAVTVISALYVRYFSPYVEGGTVCGYVEQIEHRGMVFKTYEGNLLPYKELKDTTRVYREDVRFSVPADSNAVMLKKMMFANRPVRITYEFYKGRLPWRGESNMIVTRVDTVDPRTILPPEFQPEVL